MKTIITILICIVPLLSKAQWTTINEENISNYSNLVMKEFFEENYEAAFLQLKKHWPLHENEMNNFESQTIRQMNSIAGRFGNKVEYQFMEDHLISDFGIKKIFVIRFERHLLKFEFFYYKGSDGWILNAFKWSDNIDDLWN